MEKITQKKTTTSILTVREMAVIAVMTAVTCVLAPLSIPIGPVPISLTNFVIYIALYVLGCKKGTISYLIYLLIGLVGVPVFSGFTAGPGKLFGPTGGYLIGFIPMALLAGYVIEKFEKKWYACLVAMIAGTAICYALGTAWLAYQAHMTLMEALAAGVFPFIVGDLIKMVIAMFVGPQIHRQLKRANILE